MSKQSLMPLAVQEKTAVERHPRNRAKRTRYIYFKNNITTRINDLSATYKYWKVVSRGDREIYMYDVKAVEFESAWEG